MSPGVILPSVIQGQLSHVDSLGPVSGSRFTTFFPSEGTQSNKGAGLGDLFLQSPF